MKIVSVEQMRLIEKSANDSGLGYDEMMHNAGSSLAKWISANLQLEKGVVGLIGSGNNGGDTIIALSILAQHGIRTLCFLVKPRPGDPLLEAYFQLGGSIIDISQQENLDLLTASLEPGVVILDGILGTGLKLPVRDDLLDIMQKIKEIVGNQPKKTVVAIDCPSGLDCDTGEVSEAIIKADMTLCMAAVKQGLLKHPGRSMAGGIHFMDIGIEMISEHFKDELYEMIDDALISACFPKRPEDGHKGTFGTCLVLAGSQNYIGAAYLVGKAAYFAGCGLVHVITQRKVQQAIAGDLIEAVWTILPALKGAYDPEGISVIQKDIMKADSVVVGPGWGLKKKNVQFLARLLENLPKEMPAVIDADGLKILKQIKDWPGKLPENTVLTPHPGEMSQISGLDIDEIQKNRWEIAVKYAKKWQVTLVLKGAVSVISTPEGEVFVNPISDPALATAGSGDVLSGLIGGLLAQGVILKDAVTLGTWLHGQAGKIAHDRFGTDVSVTALNILNSLGTAFLNIK